MSMLEHDYEPTPGLPQALPDGERLLWQGRAQFRRLVLSTFHVRKLAVYFALLIGLSCLYGLGASADIAGALTRAASLSLLAAVALGLLAGYAWLVSRATLYTVTNRRIVVRTGVAVPVTVNLPMTRIERAALKMHADGTGEIALVPDATGRASYVLLWPLVKPFRWIRVQPVLRGVENVTEVAGMLAEQLAGQEAAPAEPAPAPAPAGPEAKRDPRRWLAYPTLPLTAAVSLVALTVVAVGWLQLSAPDVDTGVEGRAPAAAVRLYFDDREDGSIVVTDAGSGRTLDVLEPGSNGFLRSAMRTFVNERRASDVGPETPFVLEEMPSGQLLLRDPATDRSIDLRAFGPTNAEAFGRFLELAAEGGDPDLALSNDARAPATAVALSNQEVNP